jgi:hypothetical protein
VRTGGFVAVPVALVVVVMVVDVERLVERLVVEGPGTGGIGSVGIVFRGRHSVAS